MKNNNMIWIIGIVALLIIFSGGTKKEGAYTNFYLDDCLADIADRASYGFVSPCYQINSQAVSCADTYGWLETSDIGDYYFAYDQTSRTNLDPEDEESLACLEQYSTPITGGATCNSSDISGWSCVSNIIVVCGRQAYDCSTFSLKQSKKMADPFPNYETACAELCNAYPVCNSTGFQTGPSGAIIQPCSCGGVNYNTGYCCSGIYKTESCGTTIISGTDIIATSAVARVSGNKIVADFVLSNPTSVSKTILLEAQVLFQSDKKSAVAYGDQALCDTSCPYNVHRMVTIPAGETGDVHISIPDTTTTGVMPNGVYFVKALTTDKCCIPNQDCNLNINPYNLSTGQKIIGENLTIITGGSPVADLCGTSYCGDGTCDSTETYCTCALDCTTPISCTPTNGNGTTPTGATQCMSIIQSCKKGMDCSIDATNCEISMMTWIIGGLFVALALAKSLGKKKP